MEKKIIIALIALVLNLVCFSGMLIVSSYLVSSDAVVNSFAVGNSKLQICEDLESPTQLSPGMEITKRVRIQNTGLCACRARVLVACSDSDAQKIAQITYNTDNWELREDGYWYYKGTLQPEEETPSLFDTVVISAGASPEDLKGFDIIVYGECVNEAAENF